MSIRRIDGQKPAPTSVSSTNETPAKNTVKQQGTAAGTLAQNISSGFDAARRPSELNRAEKTLQSPLAAPSTGAAGPGRVALSSPEGQAAIQATFEHLGIPTQAESLRGIRAPQTQPLVPRSIERDELGMTHVRLDRTFEGVKVFGEQLISHLGKGGEVESITGEQSAIPEGLGKTAPKLSPAQVMDIAKKEFGQKPDRQPSAERVIFKDANGQYHSGYRVEVAKVANADIPSKMNYLVDGNTGKVVEKFDTIDGFHKKAAPRTAAAAGDTTTPSTVTGTATPKSPIRDLSTVTSKLTLSQDVSIDKLQLALDIKHSNRGDLTVTLTSPSGKTATVLNREGGTANDVKGTFDLSAFAGESTKGEWTLSVTDSKKRGVGTLNSWGLTATAKGKPTPTPTPTPTGTADDTSMYSGKVDLVTKKNADGTFTLEDNTRGKGVATYDANNKETASGQTQFKDANNVWGEATDPARAKAAVDAHYGAEMTYDFYKNILGRDSLDNAGEKLTSYVHVSKNFVNAYWDGKQMNYGDGDGQEAGPLTTLDIAGHEISHGLTERTAGLNYSGESGGLNEAFSDIMGTGVEWYAAQKNPSVKWNWTVGEAAWTPNDNDPNDGLRYMNDPTKDGYSLDNYSKFKSSTEVHSSSGIANNAFYLTVEGGKNRTSGQEVKNGIGMEKGLKIYYRALAFYMTPNTTFAQAKAATIKAATDLYGANSQEVKTVTDGWSAVGVK